MKILLTSYVKIKITKINILLLVLNLSINSIIEVRAQNNQSDEQSIRYLITTYQKAVNSRDYILFKSIISKEFQIGGTPPIFSAVDVYAHLAYKDSIPNEIVRIENLTVSIEDSNHAIATFDKIYSWKRYRKRSAEVLFVKTDKGWEIKKFTQGFYDPRRGEFSMTYSVRDDGTSKDYDFKIIDLTKYQICAKNGYKVYYEVQFKQEAQYCIDQIQLVDSIITKRLGFDELLKQHIVLTTQTGTLIILGEQAVWTILLKDNQLDSNSNIIIKKLTLITSHELTENILVEKCGMLTVENRWFRDGMAEYAGYIVTKELNPEKLEYHYTTGRFEKEYKKHKQEDNLMDWRGSGPKAKEFGKLIGDKFTYENNSGQYGRSFQFFLDLSKEFGEEIFIHIHKKLMGKKNLTNRKVAKIMSRIIGIDILEKIKKY